MAENLYLHCPQVLCQALIGFLQSICPKFLSSASGLLTRSGSPGGVAIMRQCDTSIACYKGGQFANYGRQKKTLYKYKSVRGKKSRICSALINHAPSAFCRTATAVIPEVIALGCSLVLSKFILHIVLWEVSTSCKVFFVSPFGFCHKSCCFVIKGIKHFFITGSIKSQEQNNTTDSRKASCLASKAVYVLYVIFRDMPGFHHCIVSRYTIQ